MFVQRQVGHDLLQLPVLFLQLAESPEFGHPHAFALPPPPVERLLAHPDLPANFPTGLPDSHPLSPEMTSQPVEREDEIPVHPEFQIFHQ
jgi:hypothetical protein